MNYNKTILMGNLTRDPELTYTSSGVAICKFAIAYNKRRKDKDDQVSYFDIIAFGKTGETIAQYLEKGKPIFIEGEISQSRWTTDDGQKRSKVEVIVDRFQFIGGK